MGKVLFPILVVLLLTGCGGGGGAAGVLYALFATATDPRDVAFGDFNGDGFLDMAVAAYLGDNDDEVVSLFLGDGTGALGTRIAVAQNATTPSGTLLGAIHLTVGDLNGDMIDDLVVVYNDNDSYAVVLGNADPAASPPVAGAAQDLGANTFPTAAVVGDFDQDVNGYLDLAVVLSVVDQVVVFPGNGNGTFGAELDRITIGANGTPIDLARGDVNHDGNPDLAVVVTQINANTPDWVNYLQNNGDGTFSAVDGPDGSATLQADADVTMADLDGNGYDDVVRTVADTNQVAVLLADGAGNLNTPTLYTVGATPSGVALADVTGDGIPDIVTANSGDGTISTLPGNDGGGGVGDGTFGSDMPLAVPAAPGAIAAGDLDGTGGADLATVHPASNQLAVILR